ncbi:hypothetical protein V8F06_008387 [Rhypophila decipiens]
MRLTTNLVALGLMAVARVHAAEPPCTDDPVDDRVPGTMACYSSDGWSMSCDECFGRNGDPPASHEVGSICVMITDADGNFKETACPGDPAPLLPDGESPEQGVVDAFCQAQGGGGPLGQITWFGCFMYSYYNAPDVYEQNKAGITAMCDAFFVGLCTYIESGIPEIPGGGTGKRRARRTLSNNGEEQV